MDQETLIRTVADSKFADYDFVVGSTLIAYDYFIMLPKEHRYIWGTKWTPGKALYLAVRYFPMVDIPVLSLNHPLLVGNVASPCAFGPVWQWVTIAVACTLADIVYALRTWALWNKSRLMGVLIVLCGLAFNTSVVLIMAVLQPIFPTQRLAEPPGCFIVPSSSSVVWKAYVCTTCFQLFLFLATAVKGIHYWRRGPENLTVVLFRDAFLAFLIQVSLGVLNTILLIVMQDLNYSMDTTYRACLCILPVRIILNIREVANTSNLDGWDMNRSTENNTSSMEVSGLDSSVGEESSFW